MWTRLPQTHTKDEKNYHQYIELLIYGNYPLKYDST